MLAVHGAHWIEVFSDGQNVVVNPTAVVFAIRTVFC